MNAHKRADRIRIFNLQGVGLVFRLALFVFCILCPLISGAQLPPYDNTFFGKSWFSESINLNNQSTLPDPALFWEGEEIRINYDKFMAATINGASQWVWLGGAINDATQNTVVTGSGKANVTEIDGGYNVDVAHLDLTTFGTINGDGSYNYSVFHGLNSRVVFQPYTEAGTVAITEATHVSSNQLDVGFNGTDNISFTVLPAEEKVFASTEVDTPTDDDYLIQLYNSDNRLTLAEVRRNGFDFVLPDNSNTLTAALVVASGSATIPSGTVETVIEHGFGINNVIFQIFEADGLQRQALALTIHNTTDTVTISFEDITDRDYIVYYADDQLQTLDTKVDINANNAPLLTGAHGNPGITYTASNTNGYFGDTADGGRGTVKSVTDSRTVIEADPEFIRDTIGNTWQDSPTIDITISDGLNQQRADVIQSGIDHGSISGLVDDDHEIYFRADGVKPASGDWTLAGHSINDASYLSSAILEATNRIQLLDDGGGFFQIEHDGTFKLLSNLDIKLDPRGASGTGGGKIIAATMIEFDPDTIGDKIRLFSDSYALYLDNFIFGIRSDRYTHIGSDTNEDAFIFDGDTGDLTIEGNLTVTGSITNFDELAQDAVWNNIGTESLINVTYQDGTNDVDFVVEPDLSQYTVGGDIDFNQNNAINIDNATAQHITAVSDIVVPMNYNPSSLGPAGEFKIEQLDTSQAGNQWYILLATAGSIHQVIQGNFFITPTINQTGYSTNIQISFRKMTLSTAEASTIVIGRIGHTSTGGIGTGTYNGESYFMMAGSIVHTAPARVSFQGFTKLNNNMQVVPASAVSGFNLYDSVAGLNNLHGSVWDIFGRLEVNDEMVVDGTSTFNADVDIDDDSKLQLKKINWVATTGLSDATDVANALDLGDQIYIQDTAGIAYGMAIKGYDGHTRFTAFVPIEEWDDNLRYDAIKSPFGTVVGNPYRRYD